MFLKENICSTFPLKKKKKTDHKGGTPGRSQKYPDFIGIVNVMYFQKSGLDVAEPN